MSDSVVSQNVTAQVLVLDCLCQHALDVTRVDYLVLGLEIGTLKTDFVKQLLHDGVETAGADVFGLSIHAGGEIRNGGNCVASKLEPGAFGLHQRPVLSDE